MERFLAPVFGVAETAPLAEHFWTERLFSVLAVSAGVLGILLAYYLYVVRPQAAAALAERAGALYRLVLNKYYVDEAYSAAIVRPIVAGATRLLWQAVDVGLIDGAANGLAHHTRNLGGAVRHMQSGNIRSYAAWVVLGAIAVIFCMGLLWAK